ARLSKFLVDQAKQLSEMLAFRTADYFRSARKVIAGEKPDPSMHLDAGTLDRWVDYLKLPTHEHPFLNDWKAENFDADAFGQRVLDVLKEHKDIENKNFVRLGGSDARNDLARADLLSLPRDKWILWRDLFSTDRFAKFDSGIFYYKPDKIERFLSGEWKS